MVNGINKIGTFNLKVEPYLKPISDLGIGFYNLDENTATLRFQLNNSSGTLLISDENLKVYGYFESSNGSVSDVIELEIVDELNGIAEITLDKDFLHASTSTKVTGQLYIGVNNVKGKPEYNEVAVLGEFTFEVADALINKVSSFTKIEYIRMFSQLKAQIQKEVTDIQEAIKNGADYVAEMQTVKEQGITQINKTVTEGKDYIDNLILEYSVLLNESLDGFYDYGNQIKSQATTEINSKVQQSIGNIEDISNNTINHVDDKLTEFNQAIENNGFVQPTDLDNKINELNWQKYKMTNDDGTNHFVDIDYDIDALHNLPNGFHYAIKVPGLPDGLSDKGSTSAGIMIVQSGNGTKRLFFVAYTNNLLFTKNFYSTWTDWQLINSQQSDTGWVTFDLINGAKSNTAYKSSGDGGFDCAYRTIKNGDVVTKKLRINGTNLTPNQVIAQLPSNFAKNAQAFPVRVPNSSAGGYIVIRPSGRVNFYISGDSSNWTETGYAYGECTWHD